MRFRKRSEPPPFQFTIGGLLVATLFVAVMCALVGGAGALLVCTFLGISVLTLYVSDRFGPGIGMLLLFFLLGVAITLLNTIQVYLQHGAS